jgi:hypothetical protein
MKLNKLERTIVAVLGLGFVSFGVLLTVKVQQQQTQVKAAAVAENEAAKAKIKAKIDAIQDKLCTTFHTKLQQQHVTNSKAHRTFLRDCQGYASPALASKLELCAALADEIHDFQDPKAVNEYAGQCMLENSYSL